MLSPCFGTCTKIWTKLAVGWFPHFVYSCKNQGNSFLYIWHLLFCSRQNWSKLVWKFDPKKPKKKSARLATCPWTLHLYIIFFIGGLGARYVGCSEHLGWRTPKIRTCWQNAPKTLISPSLENVPSLFRKFSGVWEESTLLRLRRVAGKHQKKMFPDNYPRCFFSWLWKITCFSCQSIYTWTIFHSYLDL